MLKTISNIFINNADKIGKFFNRITIPALIIIASVARIWMYGDPNLSIAGNDTISYVESSRVPWFSSEMLTGKRLLATNLLYKVFEPKNGYQIIANGSIETTRRVFQPGFNKLVITQLALSIIGWGLLALSVSEQIRNPLIKIMSTITILLFAFTPQIADWDSILMSESLNFSLFALQLAILIKLIFSLYNDPNFRAAGWLTLWMIAYFLWTFVRPTNLFVAFITFVMCVGALAFVKYRRNKHLYIAMLFSIAVFIVGTITTGSSSRSLNVDVYYDDLLPHPARVAILQSWGMPTPGTPQFEAWFQENSTKTLIRFMVTHPGYPITKIARDFPIAFHEIEQTYFSVSENKEAYKTMLLIGEALHPENSTPFLLSLILLVGALHIAAKNQGDIRPWAWIFTWLFLSAGVSLVLSIIGDTWGINRHALLSTMNYRLCMWLFSIVMMDIAFGRDQQKPLRSQI